MIYHRGVTKTGAIYASGKYTPDTSVEYFKFEFENRVVDDVASVVAVKIFNADVEMEFEAFIA